ncbi:MAG: amino acid ABC transporter permease [Chloroflexaceae bacterium]|nr:amino acid ABC transporter permease [Chloroflexaceae bacterium]
MVVERPVERLGLIGWLHKNLFSTWYNILLTLLSLALIVAVVQPLLIWVLTQAEWDVVMVNLRLLLIGFFPLDQIWRVWVCLAATMALLGLSRGIWPHIVGGVAPVYGAGLLLLALLPIELNQRLWLVLCGGLVFAGAALSRFLVQRSNQRIIGWVAMGWVLLLPLTLWLLRGFGLVLPVIETSEWGGLLLTLVMAISGVVFAFPLGVLLAIGRRSELPAFRWFCTISIEVVRGVPLVTVLFMFLIMLPLFIPGSESTDNIARAIIGLTIFTSAYIAENVRGGLQAIPRGQFEAAKAIGLNPVFSMLLIILPQALRIVIPSNVNQFISLLKDTSLVVAAGGGIRELLGMADSLMGQAEFQGKQAEVLLFAGLIYWILAYSLTYVSKRLEQHIQRHTT